MRGMNRTTGKPMTGEAHVRQSIIDIITTQILSRVEVRDYGSRNPDLVDDPQNELFGVELHASTAEALHKWEPRFRLSSVWHSPRDSSGRVSVSVEGILIENGQAIRLEGITL